MQHTMTEKRFATLVAAYGGNPARWNTTERAAALTLLAQSATAQCLQREALVLDAQLDDLPVEPFSPFLTTRIMQHLPSPIEDSWRWLTHWLWGETASQHVLRPVLVLLVPLLCGVWLGSSVGTTYHQQTTTQTTLEQLSHAEMVSLFSDDVSATDISNEWSTWQ